MGRLESDVLAVDLGTTNTLISYFDEIGKQGECCVNQDSTNLTPSAVLFETRDSYVVGSIARESALIHPDRTAMYFKRKMGVSKEAIKVDGKVFSPQQVSSLVLKEVVESAENDLEINVKNVVITVPAYFSSDSRKATIEAGEMAGLNVVDILDEPVAALYHCDSINNLKSKTVLVFDLGGGTLDLVAAEISDNEIDEIAIDGDIHLGGIDWDQAFFHYVKENYLAGRTFEPDDEQALLMNIEKAKITLSRKEKTRITVSTNQGRVPVELSRAEFEECTKPLLNRVRTVLRNLMDDLWDQGITEFDKIIMVGGATRMTQIEKMLREFFPDTEIIAKDPDEAVAKGAAVYAKLLFDNATSKGFSVKKSFEPKRLNRISTRSYGLAARLGEGGELKICNMIYRLSELPIKKKKIFYTSYENQNVVNLKVYETTSNDRYVSITPEAFLGNCILEIPNNISKGSDIEVTFILNENGTLLIEGIEPKSGRKVKATMESKALLAEDELLEQKGSLENMKKIY